MDRLQDEFTVLPDKGIKKNGSLSEAQKSTQHELESKRRLNKSMAIKQDDEEVSVNENDESEDEEWQKVTNKRGP